MDTRPALAGRTPRPPSIAQQCASHSCIGCDLEGYAYPFSRFSDGCPRLVTRILAGVYKLPKGQQLLHEILVLYAIGEAGKEATDLVNCCLAILLYKDARADGLRPSAVPTIFRKAYARVFVAKFRSQLCEAVGAHQFAAMSRDGARNIPCALRDHRTSAAKSQLYVRILRPFPFWRTSNCTTHMSQSQQGASGSVGSPLTKWMSTTPCLTHPAGIPATGAKGPSTTPPSAGHVCCASWPPHQGPPRCHTYAPCKLGRSDGPSLPLLPMGPVTPWTATLADDLHDWLRIVVGLPLEGAHPLLALHSPIAQGGLGIPHPLQEAAGRVAYDRRAAT